MEKVKITIFEVVVLFKYGKVNEKYWNIPKFYQQLVNKALSIVEALYLNYSFLFLFNNIISHSVYA